MLRVAFDNQLQRADLVRHGGNLEMDDSGLETAVFLSLFTDRRADDDDVDDGQDKRGCWSDAFAPVAGDRQGSRLWLLLRPRSGSDPVADAILWAQEALEWMVEDGVAAEINVTADISHPGVIALVTEIVKPDKPAPKWRHTWEVLYAV